jgi:hypothetical protein
MRRSCLQGILNNKIYHRITVDDKQLAVYGGARGDDGPKTSPTGGQIIFDGQTVQLGLSCEIFAFSSPFRLKKSFFS